MAISRRQEADDKHAAPDDALPLHAQPTANLAQANAYSIALTSGAWGARYLFRGSNNSALSDLAPAAVTKMIDAPITYWFNKAEKAIGAVLDKFTPSREQVGTVEGAKNFLKSDAGKPLHAELSGVMKAHGISPKSAAELLSKAHDRAAVMDDHIKPGVRSLRARLLLDMAFGGLFTGLFGVFTYKTRQNIVRTYAEAVGYELNRDPATITYSDLKHSKNEIVQLTIDTMEKRTWMRGLNNSLFFVSAIPGLRWLHSGDIALGTTSALLLHETWNNKDTIFETIQRFVDAKLKPEAGFGVAITPADIMSLCQRYAMRTHSQPEFRHILTDNLSEKHAFVESEPLFARIAELMNNTYNFKHKPSIDPATGMSKKTANFALPKFIYLLGNGMINPYQAEWSSYYVEVANSYGIGAVKEVRQAHLNGARLSDVVKQYPVEWKQPSSVKPRESSPAFAGVAKQPDGRARTHADEHGTDIASEAPLPANKVVADAVDLQARVANDPGQHRSAAPAA